MTVVVDIACPNCERTRTVRKVAIDRYRCDDCGEEFGQGDVVPSYPPPSS